MTARRAWLLAFLLCTGPALAESPAQLPAQSPAQSSAQSPAQPEVPSPAASPRYAVVSQIGDELSIVQYRVATGSNVPSNRIQTVPTPTHAFDRSALQAAGNTLRRIDAAAPVTLLDPDANDGTADASIVDETTYSPSAALDAAILKSGATRVLLITKHRSGTRIHMRDGTLGNGTLQGLGFYIDRSLPTKSSTGGYGVGFMAPFAYFAVTLVDPSTRRVLAQQIVTASPAIGAGRAENNTDPWNALSPEEKERFIDGLVRREVTTTITAMLGKP